MNEIDNTKEPEVFITNDNRRIPIMEMPDLSKDPVIVRRLEEVIKIIREYPPGR